MSNSFPTHVLQSARLLLSMEFSRQEYWSGLPFPSPGDFPEPVIEPASPALSGGFFTIEPSEKPSLNISYYYYIFSVLAWPLAYYRCSVQDY